MTSANARFVVATFAMTVDGKVTTKNFAPVDFTSREDKLHLFRQRALADAVLIGHTSLKRDNVRLGIPEDLREARIKRKQSRRPIARDCLQQRQDRQPIEDFPIHHFADPHFFHDANAKENSSRAQRESHSASH